MCYYLFVSLLLFSTVFSFVLSVKNNFFNDNVPPTGTNTHFMITTMKLMS